MATVVQDASSSTVSENFPPAVLVIFRRSLGLRDKGTDTGRPDTSGTSTDFFLSAIDIVRAGTGGGCLGGADMIPTRNFGLAKKQQKLTMMMTTTTMTIAFKFEFKGRFFSSKSSSLFLRKVKNPPLHFSTLKHFKMSVVLFNRRDQNVRNTTQLCLA